jgi:carbamoyl-phosphate synthase large subunit
VLEKWGIHCKREPKGDELIKDIKKHKWDVIFNVPSGNSRSLGDGFQIRRAAIELGVPCVNSIEVLQALAISLAARS